MMIVCMEICYGLCLQVPQPHYISVLSFVWLCGMVDELNFWCFALLSSIWCVCWMYVGSLQLSDLLDGAVLASYKSSVIDTAAVECAESYVHVHDSRASMQL